MEFVTETQKINLDSISKSFVKNFEECPLKAWYLKRENINYENKVMKIGKVAHELFATKVAEYFQVSYQPEEEIDPAIIVAAKENLQRVNLEKLFETKDVELLGIEEWLNAKLPQSNVDLIGRADLILLYPNDAQPYVRIIDFKTGFHISNEIDNEAIFYTYLAAKTYSMDVLFTRYNGKTGATWNQFFGLEKALSFESLIDKYALKIKTIIESEEEPFPKPGAHCLNCPFLDKCSAKEYDDSNIDELIAGAELYKVKAKKYEQKIKALKEQVQTAPLETEHYKIEIKQSISKSIKGVKKADLIQILADSNQLTKFKDNLDIKVDEKAAQELEELGFKVTDRVTSRLSIEPKEE